MANSGLAMAMATNQIAACKLCGTLSPLPSTSPVSASSIKPIPRRLLRFILTASQSAGEVTAEAGEDDDEVEEAKEGEGDVSFEEKLAKLRRRVNSGTGVKAERRKARKAGNYAAVSSASTKGKETVLLPPVPLLDPISDGLRVELGFNSYTERINGRFAALGLAAFLLVELATGSSFLKFHESPVIGLQAYFMLAVSAIFIKYEKEKISIWPGPKS